MEGKLVLFIAERFESKHFPLEIEVDVRDYNATVDSAKKKKKKSNEFKAFINIVWDADRSNEFVERLENLGVADKLADLLQKEKKNDIDKIQGFISDSFHEAAEISKKETTAL